MLVEAVRVLLCRDERAWGVSVAIGSHWICGTVQSTERRACVVHHAEWQNEVISLMQQLEQLQQQRRNMQQLLLLVLRSIWKD